METTNTSNNNIDIIRNIISIINDKINTINSNINSVDNDLSIDVKDINGVSIEKYEHIINIIQIINPYIKNIKSLNNKKYINILELLYIFYKYIPLINQTTQSSITNSYKSHTNIIDKLNKLEEKFYSDYINKKIILLRLIELIPEEIINIEPQPETQQEIYDYNTEYTTTLISILKIIKVYIFEYLQNLANTPNSNNAVLAENAINFFNETIKKEKTESTENAIQKEETESTENTLKQEVVKILELLNPINTQIDPQEINNSLNKIFRNYTVVDGITSETFVNDEINQATELKININTNIKNLNEIIKINETTNNDENTKKIYSIIENLDILLRIINRKVYLDSNSTVINDINEIINSLDFNIIYPLRNEQYIYLLESLYIFKKYIEDILTNSENINQDSYKTTIKTLDELFNTVNYTKNSILNKLNIIVENGVISPNNIFINNIIEKFDITNLDNIPNRDYKNFINEKIKLLTILNFVINEFNINFQTDGINNIKPNTESILNNYDYEDIDIITVLKLVKGYLIQYIYTKIQSNTKIEVIKEYVEDFINQMNTACNLPISNLQTITTNVLNEIKQNINLTNLDDKLNKLLESLCVGTLLQNLNIKNLPNFETLLKINYNTTSNKKFKKLAENIQKAEEQRKAEEAAQRERLEAEEQRAAEERLAAEQKAAELEEQRAKEKAEAERLEAEKAEKEKAEKEKAEKEKAEVERLEAEKREKLKTHQKDSKECETKSIKLTDEELKNNLISLNKFLDITYLDEFIKINPIKEYKNTVNCCSTPEKKQDNIICESFKNCKWAPKTTKKCITTIDFNRELELQESKKKDILKEYISKYEEYLKEKRAEEQRVAAEAKAAEAKAAEEQKAAEAQNNKNISFKNFLKEFNDEIFNNYITEINNILDSTEQNKIENLKKYLEEILKKSNEEINNIIKNYTEFESNIRNQYDKFKKCIDDNNIIPKLESNISIVEDKIKVLEGELSALKEKKVSSRDRNNHTINIKNFEDSIENEKKIYNGLKLKYDAYKSKNIEYVLISEEIINCLNETEKTEFYNLLLNFISNINIQSSYDKLLNEISNYLDNNIRSNEDNVNNKIKEIEFINKILEKYYNIYESEIDITKQTLNINNTEIKKITLSLAELKTSLLNDLTKLVIKTKCIQETKKIDTSNFNNDFVKYYLTTEKETTYNIENCCNTYNIIGNSKTKFVENKVHNCILTDECDWSYKHAKCVPTKKYRTNIDNQNLLLTENQKKFNKYNEIYIKLNNINTYINNLYTPNTNILEDILKPENGNLTNLKLDAKKEEILKLIVTKYNELYEIYKTNSNTNDNLKKCIINILNILYIYNPIFINKSQYKIDTLNKLDLENTKYIGQTKFGLLYRFKEIINNIKLNLQYSDNTNKLEYINTLQSGGKIKLKLNIKTNKKSNRKKIKTTNKKSSKKSNKKSNRKKTKTTNKTLNKTTKIKLKLK